MSRKERKAMIRRDAPDLSLSRQCAILSISRSSLYYRAKGESPENLALMRRIDATVPEVSVLRQPPNGAAVAARRDQCRPPPCAPPDAPDGCPSSKHLGHVSHLDNGGFWLLGG